MAIRRRQVHPDEILTLRDGREVPVVSDEAWLGALLEMGRVVSIAGGTISGTVFRAATDLEGEMVTVHAVLEWKDRTDARPQPEPATRAQAVPGDLIGSPEWTPLPAEDTPPTPEEVLADVHDARDGGLGSGALPFQGAEAYEPAPEHNYGSDLALEAAREAAPVYEAKPGPPPPGPGVLSNVTDDGEPVLPRPGRDDDVNDGLSGIGGEDLSEIPEHMR